MHIAIDNAKEGGDAPKAGYYIINKRGRNKLVPLGKEITIDDRR